MRDILTPPFARCLRASRMYRAMIGRSLGSLVFLVRGGTNSPEGYGTWCSAIQVSASMHSGSPSRLAIHSALSMIPSVERDESYAIDLGIRRYQVQTRRPILRAKRDGRCKAILVSFVPLYVEKHPKLFGIFRELCALKCVHIEQTILDMPG